MDHIIEKQKTTLETPLKKANMIELLLGNKRSEHTKKAYLYDINQFFTYLTGDKATSDSIKQFLSLSRTRALEIVLTYKNYLISDKQQAESTINRRLSAIRSLIRLAKTLGYCDYDLNEIKSEKVQTYRDTSGVNLDQFKEMLQIPNRDTLKGKRDYAILLLLFETAMRRGELVKITLGDYQPEDRTIWILGKGRGTQKEAITISNQMVQIIEIYLNERKKHGKLEKNTPLFATTDKRTCGGAMSGEAIRRVIRNCAHAAGIEKPISPHKIRHSAITIALDQTNGDVRSVQKLSRHKKIDTLLIYDDNRKDQQGQMTDLLSSLF